ncbi:hypothetical protein AGR1B_Lc50059 [Agrobacterium fabacearum S56]|nr:hypothetical protein AGR1B_Lc50059 [Agrobacterium fabacearum S56]
MQLYPSKLHDTSDVGDAKMFGRANKTPALRPGFQMERGSRLERP